MAYRGKDYKQFEKKPNPPYTKPLPICTTLREGEHINDFIARMAHVRDWHQDKIDNTHPGDKIYGPDIPRHQQIVGSINQLFASLA